MTSPKNSGLDWGKTAADYAAHRHGFPATFYERLAAMFERFSEEPLAVPHRVFAVIAH
jgi:hypothetical protein